MKPEWETEPDNERFRDTASGYLCVVSRHPILKHLCGYVVLPKGHVLEGLSHLDHGVTRLDVHGGVTYARGGVPLHREQSATPGDTGERWVLGFDCGHFGDFVPEVAPRIPGENAAYRNFAYVRAECVSLAAQLAQVQAEHDSSWIMKMWREARRRARLVLAGAQG